MRLFCIPHAGAGASGFLGWAAELAPAVRLIVVQLPGREDRVRDSCLTRLDPVLDELLPIISDELAQPFAIFGHSMGALIGYELTRRLRDARLPRPAHLFVSGHPAPHLPRTQPAIGDLPERDFLNAARNLNGFPPAVFENPALVQLISPVLRADFQLCEGYQHRPGEPLDTPVSVFGGTEDNVPVNELAEWKSLTTGPFDLSMVPGDHFFPHSARRQLTSKILDSLAVDTLYRRDAGHGTNPPASAPRAKTRS